MWVLFCVKEKPLSVMLGLSFDTEILTMDAHSEFVAGGLMTLR